MQFDTRTYSPLAREVERMSLIQLAKRHYLKEQELLEILFDGFLQAKKNWPDSDGPRHPDIEETSDNFLELNHRVYKETVATDIDIFCTALSNCSRGLKLVDFERLRKDSPTGKSEIDLVRKTLLNCETVFPLLGGFNASVSIPLQSVSKPILKLYAGVAECLFNLSVLLIHYCTEEVSSSELKVSVGKIQRNPKKPSREFDELIDLTLGNRLSCAIPSRMPYFGPHQRLATAFLCGGAMSFVKYHEFAHLLVKTPANSHELEHLCDLLATHISYTQFKPAHHPSLTGFALTGVFLTLLVLDLLTPEALRKASTSHPDPQIRMHCVFEMLACEYGIRFNKHPYSHSFNMLDLFFEYVRQK